MCYPTFKMGNVKYHTLCINKKFSFIDVICVGVFNSLSPRKNQEVKEFSFMDTL
jgi:hypothetical protein